MGAFAEIGRFWPPNKSSPTKRENPAECWLYGRVLFCANRLSANTAGAFLSRRLCQSDASKLS
jgi:hypothetical protein